MTRNPGDLKELKIATQYDGVWVISLSEIGGSGRVGRCCLEGTGLEAPIDMAG